MGTNGRAMDGAGERDRDRSGTRVAVIDLGTNSTRLLVADVDPGAGGNPVRELERDTRVTRLGRGVDLTRKLSDDGIERVCAAVADYVATIHLLQPDRTVAIATSAVRDAANGEAFIAELRERFDLSPRVIDGETEARLTFAGVCADRDDEGCLLVCDIGGGSTELIAGCGEELELSVSAQAGVVRQTERHLCHDPPDQLELERLANEVRSTLGEALTGATMPALDGAVAVAGTATSLAAIELGLDPYDPEQVHGHRLTIEAVQRTLARLASMPMADRFHTTGLQPGRAPTIVAGVVILIQIMRTFGLTEIEVSEHDILHGAALDAAAAVAQGAAGT